MHKTSLLNYGPNFIKAERSLYNKNAREIKLNLIQIYSLALLLNNLKIYYKTLWNNSNDEKLWTKHIDRELKWKYTKPHVSYHKNSNYKCQNDLVRLN